MHKLTPYTNIDYRFASAATAPGRFFARLSEARTFLSSRAAAEPLFAASLWMSCSGAAQPSTSQGKTIVWPSPRYGSRRSAWPFRVKLWSVSVSELMDMRGFSEGRTVPKQCRSVEERYEF